MPVGKPYHLTDKLTARNGRRTSSSTNFGGEVYSGKKLVSENYPAVPDRNVSEKKKKSNQVTVAVWPTELGDIYHSREVIEMEGELNQPSSVSFSLNEGSSGRKLSYNALVPVSNSSAQVGPSVFITGTTLQRTDGSRALVTSEKMEQSRLKLSMWPSPRSNLTGTHHLVSKPPLALQLEAFIRKEHRQFLLEHPGCTKCDTLQIFREAFQVLSQHFSEYRPLMTLIHDEYEAALNDVLSEVKRMRIIDLENKSDRSLHAMELATVKESLNTTISNQKAELEAAQGLITSLREQLFTAQETIDTLRYNIRKAHLEQVHAQEEVKLLSQSMIDEANRSGLVLQSLKKKDQDINLLMDCVKVLRDEVEELHSALINHIHLSMKSSQPSDNPSVLLPKSSNPKAADAVAAVKKVNESKNVMRDIDQVMEGKLVNSDTRRTSVTTNAEQLEEEEEKNTILGAKTYPEAYVLKLLSRMDDLYAEVEQLKNKVTEGGKSDGDASAGTRATFVEYHSPLADAKGSNSYEAKPSPPERILIQSRRGLSGGPRPLRRSSSGGSGFGYRFPVENPQRSSPVTKEANGFYLPNSVAESSNIAAHSRSSGTSFSRSIGDMRGGIQNLQSSRRPVAAHSYPLIESWLREEGISEADLVGADYIIPSGTWEGMDMSFLQATAPVRCLHLELPDVRFLIDRIWKEREAKLTYERLRTYFSQWLNTETGNSEAAKELGVNMIHISQKNFDDPDCYVFLHALRGFLPEDVALTWRKAIRHLRRICEKKTEEKMGQSNGSSSELPVIHVKDLSDAVRSFFPEKPMENIQQLRFFFFRASGGLETTPWEDLLKDNSEFVQCIKRQTVFEVEAFTLQIVEALKASVDLNKTDQIAIKKVVEVFHSCDPGLPEHVVRHIVAEGCQKTIREVITADDSVTVTLTPLLSRFRSAVLLRRSSVASHNDVEANSEG